MLLTTTAAASPEANRPAAVPRERRRTHAVTALLTLLVCALGSVLATATPATAHAALTGSSPAEKSVVDSAPEQVVLTFSEGVSMSDGSLRVLDPKGGRADTGPVRDLAGSGGETAKRGVALKSGLPDGTYTVAWQAVSADSHPVSGAFTFSVGAPSTTAPAVQEEAAGPDSGSGLVGALYETGRYTAYTGFVLLAGGSAFVLMCWRRGAAVRPVQRLVVTGWVTLAAATLAMLLLRNPYTGSGELSDVLDPGGLRDVLGTKTGGTLVARLLLLGAAALFVSVLLGPFARRQDDEGKGAEEATSLPRPRGFRLGLGGAVLATGLATTWAMAEHASTGIQTALAVPADVVHLLAVAVWLGGVATLLTALTWGPPVPRDALRRFSRCAFWSVAALVATGLYQSWRQVGSWNALAGTPYGQLLLVKAGLVGLLLAVAWISRRWTARLSGVPETLATVPGPRPDSAHETCPEPVPGEAASGAAGGAAVTDARAAQLARQRAAVDDAHRKKVRDADPVRSGLRRSVLAEAGIAVVVLAVTTALTGTEPARTAASAGDSPSSPPASSHEHGQSSGTVEFPFDTGGPGGKGTAELRLDPGRTGGNTLRVNVTAPDGEPVEAPEVKIALTLPAKDIGPISVTPDPVGGKKGSWRATDVQLPIAGSWKAAVTIRTSDIDQVTETRTVHIG